MERIIRQVQFSYIPIPKRKRVAAYTRVSSEKDAALNSLSAQVSHYSRLIQQNIEWKYAGVYSDEAISGTKGSRPGFQQLIKDCRAGRIDIILTKSISRFARNTVTLLETIRELKALQVDVHFEEENIHSLSGDGELMLSILAAFAQIEALSVSENCKWHYRKRFSEGHLAGTHFLYGYRIERGRIQINPEQAAIVRSIYSDYISGIGITDIMRRLNRDGIPTYRGFKWTQPQIQAILANEKYAGNALLQKTFIADHISKVKKRNQGECDKFYVTETHPPIVDEVTFEKAKSIRERNRMKNNISKETPPKYPYTSKIRCQKCGAKYKRVKVRLGFSWCCSSYIRFGKSVCQSKKIPEITLMAITAEVLGLESFDPDVFSARIDEIIVPEVNTLVFQIKNGDRVLRDWQDRSRRESWTKEMRQAARGRLEKRKGVV